ncbi:O-antigen polymerase [Reticulibacter mediterranei]|uniref:O-antigen polymerase n=1 Tax=Reticulibacter mediterranei TaxID=2778369 RepID=A0A8J3I9W6_9CHLR|nr:O-antigen ligase family protein [Reticulibacter mediterranei]GHO91574.1 O-antigen polymerase [Reticulibacter mediterranei]
MENLHTRATLANIVGLLGGIFVLACLLLLPMQVSFRLLLYLAAAIWTLLRPRMVLYLLPLAVAWGSLDPITLSGMNLTSADILVFLLAANWLMSFPLRKFAASASPHVALSTAIGPLDKEHAATSPRYLILATAILLGTMCLSIVGAASISLSLKEIFKWVEFALLLLIGTQYIRTRQQIWTLIVLICLAALSQAFLGYIQAYFNLGPAAFTRGGSKLLRVYGSFNQPNPYAGYINITLALTLALALLGRNLLIRILSGITAILLALALYLSQSRGADIAVAAAFLFIISVGMPRLHLLIKAGGIAVLTILGAYFAGIVPQRFLLPLLKQLGLASISFIAPSEADYSTAERLAHWIAGVNMFLDHPFFGVGIGNYPAVYSKYFITIFALPLGHAHNYYINMAAETGIFGLAGFMLLLMAIFLAGSRTVQTIYARLKQIQPQQQTVIATGQEHVSIYVSMLVNDRALAIGLLAALVSICVHNLFDNLYVHSMTNLFALLLVALIRLEGVMPIVGSNGGHFDYRESSRSWRRADR